MAISVHTGYPGAGKSHALVKDVIVPAVMKGRRVLTNIEGINPGAIAVYCAERVKDGTGLGSVIYFDGAEALKPGFWPTEVIPDTQTVVKGGDLIVFDEWRLFFKNRAKDWAPDDVVKFMRWHRHLTHEKGHSTDVHIGTQLATDLHPDIRGLCERSYKYAKLRAVGFEGKYSCKIWQGHLQPKGENFASDIGDYDKEIFPLYASSAAANGSHVELKTNRRDTIWSRPGTWAAVIAPVVLFLGGAFYLSRVMGEFDDGQPAATGTATAGAQGALAAPAYPPGVGSAPVGRASPWRIVGSIDGVAGTRVILAHENGAIRSVEPGTFDFENGRPIAGSFEGNSVFADQALSGSAETSGSPFGGNYR